MKRYEVLGGHAVLGHQPGTTFSADLPAAQEQRMLDRGSLRLVPSESLGSLTRDQLDERARAVGVDSPEDLANKQAVVEAIENTQHDSTGGD